MEIFPYEFISTRDTQDSTIHSLLEDVFIFRYNFAAKCDDVYDI